MSDPIHAALHFLLVMSRTVERAEAPAPPPVVVVVAPVVPGPTDAQWAALRQCESGGRYRVNTGNGYYGAYQFDWDTWASYGTSGNPAAASPAEQDRRARALYAARGSSPWPVCGAYLH